MAKKVKYVLPYPPPISTRDSAEEAQRKLAKWQKANIKSTYNPRFHDGPPPPDFVDSPLWRVEYEPIEMGTVDHPPPQVIPAAAPEPPVKKPVKAPPQFDLQKGVLIIGKKRFSLEGTEADVLKSLVEFSPVKLTKLRRESTCETAHKVLKRLVEKYSVLAKHVTFPVKRGQGGYSTTIEPV